MKSFLLGISLLLLTGCTFVRSELGIPSFKLGDCIAMDSYVKELSEPVEEWEKPKTQVKYMELIVAVGKKNYQTITMTNDGMAWMTTQPIRYDDIYQKVECSARIQEYLNKIGK